MAEVFRLDLNYLDKRLEGVVCCMGVFDGLHRGHQALIARTVTEAARFGEKAAIITFGCDPEELFRADKLKKIMGNDQRIAALAATDADYVAVLPFNKDFAALAPRDFLAEAFGAATPCKLIVGPDFRFGCRAAGTVDTLKEWGSVHGMDLEPFDLLQYDVKPITATRIRGLLSEGRLDLANELLGHRFSIEGVIESGRGEGGDMGFKTANLSFDAMHHVLLDGVYAGYATVEDATYKAAISMGVSPTFADRATSNCEVHLLQFEGDVYGAPMKVEFAQRLRPMIKFDSIDELIETVMRDINWVAENL